MIKQFVVLIAMAITFSACADNSPPRPSLFINRSDDNNVYYRVILYTEIDGFIEWNAIGAGRRLDGMYSFIDATTGMEVVISGTFIAMETRQ